MYKDEFKQINKKKVKEKIEFIEKGDKAYRPALFRLMWTPLWHDVVR